MTDFDLAAITYGHDPTTTVGAADARADHRVWDVLDEPQTIEAYLERQLALSDSPTVVLFRADVAALIAKAKRLGAAQ